MSTVFQIIFLVVMAIGFAVLVWLNLRKTGKDEGQDEKLKQVHEEISKIKDEMKGSLEKNLEFIQKQSHQQAGKVRSHQ